MRLIRESLEQGEFHNAYKSINEMMQTIKLKTKNDELLRQQSSEVEKLLVNTLKRLMIEENFELLASFLSVFGVFFKPPGEEGTLVIPQELLSNEKLRQTIRQYILDSTSYTFRNIDVFKSLVENFDRLGFVSKTEIINSPELKEKAMEFLTGYLKDMEAKIEEVVEEIKEREKSILFEQEYESRTSEEKIKKLAREIEEYGLEKAITDGARLNFLREKAIKRTKDVSDHFKELLGLKNGFFYRINSFIKLGIIKEVSEAINHRIIKKQLSEMLQRWQNQFQNNPRELELRLQLLRHGKRLKPEDFNKPENS